MKRKETDEEFSNRLCSLLPRGAVYTAADLGALHGEDLDLYVQNCDYFKDSHERHWIQIYPITMPDANASKEEKESYYNYLDDCADMMSW
jgi:hypothetical protein